MNNIATVCNKGNNGHDKQQWQCFGNKKQTQENKQIVWKDTINKQKQTQKNSEPNRNGVPFIQIKGLKKIASSLP
jgi:hypothetical protein